MPLLAPTLTVCLLLLGTTRPQSYYHAHTGFYTSVNRGVASPHSPHQTSLPARPDPAPFVHHQHHQHNQHHQPPHYAGPAVPPPRPPPGCQLDYVELTGEVCARTVALVTVQAEAKLAEAEWRTECREEHYTRICDEVPVLVAAVKPVTLRLP